MEVRQSGPPHSNRLKIKCYSPLVAAMVGKRLMYRDLIA